MLKSRFDVQQRWKTWYSGGPLVLVPQKGAKGYLIAANQSNVSICNLQMGTYVELDALDTDLFTDQSDVVTALAYLSPVDNSNNTLDIEGLSGHLMIAYRSCQIRIVSLSTLQTVAKWKGHESPILCAHAKRKGQHVILATGSADSSIKCWDLSRVCSQDGGDADLGLQSYTHHFKAHRGLITSVQFNLVHDGWLLASGDEYGNLRLWNLAANYEQKQVPRRVKSKLATVYITSSFDGIHASLVRSLSWSQDGKFLITGGRDKVVSIFQLDTLSLNKVKTVPVFDSVEASGFLDNGMHYYTAGESGKIRIWSVATNSMLHESDCDGQLTHALYDHHNKALVTSTFEQRLQYLQLDTNMHVSLVNSWIGAWDEVSDLCFVNLGLSKCLLVASGATEDLRLLSATQNLSHNFQEQFMGDVKLMAGHSKAVVCIDGDNLPDDSYLAVSGSKDASVRIWQLNCDQIGVVSYQCIGECVGHAGAIASVALSKYSSLPELHQRFVLTVGEDRTVKYWNLHQLNNTQTAVRMKSTYTIKCHDKDINCIAVSPSVSKNLFATASQDKTIKLWNVDDGTLLTTLKGHRRGVWNLKFSTNPNSVLGQPILASCSGDKTIKIWSLSDFSCLNTFEGHTNSVLKLSFLSDDQQLFSSGSDGLGKLWNVKTGECVLTLDEHEDKIWANSIDPQTSTSKCLIATGSSDASIVLFEDTTKEHIEEENKKAEELILNEQALDNHVRNKDWLQALKLSLRLNKSVKCADLIQCVFKHDVDQAGQTLLKLFKELSSNELAKIVAFIRDWNTHNKLALVAQKTLYLLLTNFPPQTFADMPNVKTLVDAMLPHTERHFNRVDYLLQQTWLIDFCMSSS